MSEPIPAPRPAPRPTPRRRVPPAVLAVLESPRLTETLTTAGFAIAATSTVIRRLIGTPGLLAALATLLVVMGLSFLARRREVELTGLLPLSLLGFLGWAVVSLAWSTYPLQTLQGIAYLVAFTLAGLYVALLRDTVQIIRSMGDVTRVVLAVSLALEVFSGIVIDTPLPALGVSGGLATLSPITGIAGTRNMLGMIATIGAVTAVLEWRTRMTTRTVSAASVGLAVVTMVLTQSPVTLIVGALVAVAFVVLFLLRRIRPERRTAAQLIALAFAAVLLGVLWTFRRSLVAAANATGEFDYRLKLWQQIVPVRELRELLGWGWIGRWNRDVAPFSYISVSDSRPATSALNSYLDVWLQVGVVGLILLVITMGLAFVRSWLLAGHRRSVVYTWPAMVLVTILFTVLGESLLIVELGWMLLVVCSVKGSQELSWRGALDRGVRRPGTP